MFSDTEFKQIGFLAVLLMSLQEHSLVFVSELRILLEKNQNLSKTVFIGSFGTLFIGILCLFLDVFVKAR